MKPLSWVIGMLVCLAAASVAGCKREQSQPAASSSPRVAATSTVLATLSATDLKPETGGTAPGHAGAASSGQGGESTILFSELGGGVAYIAQQNGNSHLVLNGQAGKGYEEIDQNYVLSRDGRHVVYAVKVKGKWRMVADGVAGVEFDTVGTPRISLDGKHTLYDAQRGDRWFLVVDGALNGGAPSYFDKNFINDSSKLVYIENVAGDDGMHRVIISDLSFGKLFGKDLRVENTIYNEDKSRMAVVAGIGAKKQLVVVDLENPGTVNEGALYDEISFPTFSPDGKITAYFARKEGKRYLVLNGKEEVLPDGEVGEAPAVSPDLKGGGVILKTNKGFYLHRAGGGEELSSPRYEEAALLSFSRVGDSYAYVARNGKKMFYVINGKSSPPFDRALAPAFTPDGKQIVGRVRKEGKRFVVVIDGGGRVVQQHPDYEMVFNPVFTSDGKFVAYGVKDGTRLAWKVEKLP